MLVGAECLIASCTSGIAITLAVRASPLSAELTARSWRVCQTASPSTSYFVFEEVRGLTPKLVFRSACEFVHHEDIFVRSLPLDCLWQHVLIHLASVGDGERGCRQSFAAFLWNSDFFELGLCSSDTQWFFVRSHLFDVIHCC